MSFPDNYFPKKFRARVCVVAFFCNWMECHSVVIARNLTELVVKHSPPDPTAPPLGQRQAIGTDKYFLLSVRERKQGQAEATKLKTTHSRLAETCFHICQRC